jgi:hypothetical protein
VVLRQVEQELPERNRVEPVGKSGGARVCGNFLALSQDIEEIAEYGIQSYVGIITALIPSQLSLWSASSGLSAVGCPI